MALSYMDEMMRRAAEETVRKLEDRILYGNQNPPKDVTPGSRENPIVVADMKIAIDRLHSVGEVWITDESGEVIGKIINVERR